MMQSVANAAAPHLVKQAVPAMNRYGGPVALAGKIIGLSQAEVKAGIPWWGWAAVGFGAGAVAAYLFHDRIEKIVE